MIERKQRSVQLRNKKVICRMIVEAQLISETIYSGKKLSQEIQQLMKER